MYTAEASIETKLGEAQGWKDVLTAAGFRFRKAAKNLPDAVFFPLKDEKGKLRQCGDILRSLLGMLHREIMLVSGQQNPVVVLHEQAYLVSTLNCL